MLEIKLFKLFDHLMGCAQAIRYRSHLLFIREVALQAAQTHSAGREWKSKQMVSHHQK